MSDPQQKRGGHPRRKQEFHTKKRSEGTPFSPPIFSFTKRGRLWLFVSLMAEKIQVEGGGEHLKGIYPKPNVDGIYIREEELRNGKYCYTKKKDGGAIYYSGKKDNKWKICQSGDGLRTTGWNYRFLFD